MHCDCGQQFIKSLHLIGEEGGILIYLRQEGRGIGLVEKIKSYQLQAQGCDTFQANVMLGHRPDARSYEMVKMILDDLGVKRIKLLTNNPSKVSDIAKTRHPGHRTCSFSLKAKQAQQKISRNETF